MAGSRGRGGTRVKRQPSSEWLALQAILILPDQIAYEVIHPVVTLGQDLKSRAADVGVTPHTLALIQFPRRCSYHGGNWRALLAP